MWDFGHRNVRRMRLSLSSPRAAAVPEEKLGIILPVGCGRVRVHPRLTPFAFKSRRTLVVAPGLAIAGQLHDDFDPALPEMFYIKSGALPDAPFPGTS